MSELYYTRDEEACAEAIFKWLLDNSIYKGGQLLAEPAYNNIRVEGYFKLGDLARVALAAVTPKA